MSPPQTNRTTSTSSAETIVREMFEGQQKKKLEGKEQAVRLQEQSLAQQNLRQASGTEREAKTESERSREQSPETKDLPKNQGATRGGREDSRTRTERQMDGFLQRSSVENRTREAGKELNQEQKLPSQNARSWSVANSPQTPPQARETLLARHNPSSTTHAQARTPQQKETPLPSQRSNHPNPGSFAGSPRTTPESNRSQSSWIQYRQERSPENSKQPFAQRMLASDRLSQQIQKLAIASQGNPLLAQNQNADRPVVLVNLRSHLVFVRDGGKTRAFKLEKDGTLTELPGEHAQGEPLSPEAQAMLKKVLRQKGVNTGSEGKSLKEELQLDSATSQEALAKKTEGNSETEETEIDLESRFALLLHAVLEEKKKNGKKLNSEESPQFPQKKDWEAFFANLGKTGNQEKKINKTLEEVLSLLFRGLFQKKGGGQEKYLVGDLSYQQGNKTKTEKFARIPIQSEEMLQLLSSLQPGQALDPQMLRRLGNKELSYLIMAHIAEQNFNMASSAERNTIFNPRANVDPFSQARLENALLNKKRGQSPALPGAEEKNSAELAAPPNLSSGAFGNIYELLGLREVYDGHPKLYTAIAYTLMGSTLLALLLWAFLHFQS